MRDVRRRGDGFPSYAHRCQSRRYQGLRAPLQVRCIVRLRACHALIRALKRMARRPDAAFWRVLFPDVPNGGPGETSYTNGQAVVRLGR